MALKFFIPFLLLVVTTVFADGLCVQLCVDCSTQDSSNPTCSRVDQVCGNCPAILDSIQHVKDSLAQRQIQDSLAAIARADSIQREKELKDSLQKSDIRKLAEIMQNNCKSDTCIFEVTVDNGSLGHIRAKKGNKVSAIDTTTQVPLLPPMSDECQGLCNTCNEQYSADPTASNPICETIETQCRCAAYVEQERMLAEKAEADSIAAVKKFLNQMQGVQTSAKSIFDFCGRKVQTKQCSVMVKLKNEAMSVVEFRDLAPKPDPTPIAKEASIDSVKKQVDTTKASASATSDVTTKNHANPYYGISFAFESFLEHEVAGYFVEREKQYGIDLGFLIRWYLYKWGSFQSGINLVFHFADHTINDNSLDTYNLNGEGSISYQNLMLEIPIQFRFGFPLGNGQVVPFASTSFHVRKPIYAWVDYEADWYTRYPEYGYYSHYADNSYSDTYALADWEFLPYIGLGVEFNRRISLQWQVAPVSIVTYTTSVNNYYCDDENGLTWRLNLDYAW